jgi:hypothetical protein
MIMSMMMSSALSKFKYSSTLYRTKFSTRVLLVHILLKGTWVPVLILEVLNVKETVFILLLFASLPDCGQNQTAVSDEQHLLSNF